MLELMRSPASATMVPAGVRMAHLLLELLDLLGDRRGGDHEDVSGGDDAAFARYR